jgi:hygromycin-B 7''-O-kinase
MTRQSYGSLGEIDESQLQAVLDRFALGALVAAEPLTIGLFGKNVALTATSGSWVLRGAPWPAGVDHQFRRERFFASAIRAGCEVPVPWPYLIEADSTLFGWPYAVMPRLAGVTLDTVGPAKDGHDWEAVAGALGRAAARLRAVPFSAFGEWSPERDELSPFEGSASDWLAHRVEWWIRACTDQSRSLADSDVAWLNALVDDVAVEIGVGSPEWGYVHHDFKAGNVVVTDIAGCIEVCGLFDLGEGLVADPLEDLARCTWDLANRIGPRCSSTFLDSYVDAVGAALSRERLRAYVVFDLLVIWEFGSRASNRWFSAPTFKEWAATMLDRVDEAIEMAN